MMDYTSICETDIAIIVDPAADAITYPIPKRRTLNEVATTLPTPFPTNVFQVVTTDCNPQFVTFRTDPQAAPIARASPSMATLIERQPMAHHHCSVRTLLQMCPQALQLNPQRHSVLTPQSS